MGTFTESRVRAEARGAATGMHKSMASILAEAAKAPKTSFDIFLSHSIRDEDIVLGVKAILEKHGKSVYVDWVEDKELDRSGVTKASADKIRSRMQQCKSLIYIHTQNSPGSKWMPWELGYFDGKNGRVAIFPVTKVEEASFSGQEYLGLYPYVDEAELILEGKRTGKTALWANRSSSEYAQMDEWMASTTAIRKRA